MSLFVDGLDEGTADATGMQRQGEQRGTVDGKLRDLPDGAVKVLLYILQKLLNDKPIHFYEFVMLCRDPNHQVFTPAILTDLSADYSAFFDTPGRPGKHIRDVVLSCVKGDGIEMRIEFDSEERRDGPLRNAHVNPIGNHKGH